MVYDIIIIGGGPGGLSAGIYGSRSKLKTLIIEKKRVGGQAATTEEMENYPAFFGGTTGPGLMKQMEDHAVHFGTEIIKDDVLDISTENFVKKVTTKNGEYLAKTVIISTGAEPRILGAKGENELRGKGVSYCATCDADFYEELDVVVVGNGDAAIEEALYLTKFADKVTIIVIHEEGVLDATPIIQERAFQNPKIEFVWSSVLEEIVGDEIVEGVKIKSLKTGEITDLEVNGVFIFVGTVPNTKFLGNIVELDERGYILTSEDMETSADGIFAVGDVRQKSLRQVITAAADGAIAAVAAEKYIHEEEMFEAEVLKESKPVAVLFWTPGDQECINLVADVEKNLDPEKVKLVKVDAHRSVRIKNRCNVNSIPTLLMFENGKVTELLEGSEKIIMFSKESQLTTV